MMKLTAADGHEFETFEAGNVNAPRGLVVVQEIFGVNGHMRLVSERLAGFGYRVLCPALFDRAERGTELGYTQDDVQKGLALRAQITEDQVMADIEATAAAFGDKPVGIIGYCWGGSIAWMGATRTSIFKAASGWYGGSRHSDERRGSDPRRAAGRGDFHLSRRAARLRLRGPRQLQRARRRTRRTPQPRLLCRTFALAPTPSPLVGEGRGGGRPPRRPGKFIEQPTQTN
jgi:pimeloyl-ACP methyl ester carboxylesterase